MIAKYCKCREKYGKNLFFNFFLNLMNFLEMQTRHIQQDGDLVP